MDGKKNSYQQIFIDQVAALVKNQRARCLWFIRENYVPETMDAAERILDHIEKHGDQAAFAESRRLREWLSLHSSVNSAG